METSTFYNLQLENDIKDAISLIEVDPSKKNKKILTDLLKNKFDKNKGTFFEMFSNDRLTIEQQKFLFDSIEPQSAKLTTKTSTQPEVSS